MVSVRVETPIYKSFPHFMRHDDNKTELFGMIVDASIKNEAPGTTIVATKLEKIVSNHDINRSKLEPCGHEEADTRVMLHAVDITSAGFNKLSTVTVDTDVVVIALHHFHKLNLEEMWIEFGVGKNRRYLPVHPYAETLY